MHEKTTEQYKSSHERHDLWLGVTRAEWLISGIVGIVSASVAAAVTVRDRFMDEVVKWPGIDQKYADLQRDLTNANLRFDGHPKKWWDHISAINKTKKDFWRGVDKELETRWGIVPRAEKFFSVAKVKDLTSGTWQKALAASPNTRETVIRHALTGAVIGAAATLSFFNGVASRHKIERIEDAVTNPERSR